MSMPPPAESVLRRVLRSIRKTQGLSSAPNLSLAALQPFTAVMSPAVCIFVLALVLRLVFILSITAAPLETDALDYDTLGWQLAQGKGYMNSAGEPTAYRPPVYPVVIGLIYFVAGHDPVWVRWVQAFIGAWTCVLVYLLTRSVFKHGTLAGLVAAMYPPLIVNTAEILTETLFAFLLLAVVYLVISKKSQWWRITSGVTLGLALLTRPMAVFFLPFLGYWMFANRARRALALVALGLVLSMAPWTARNYTQLDAFVPFANVGGLTLYNSYIVSPGGFGYNSLNGVGETYFQIESETERSRYLVGQTLLFISQNPLQAVKLGALKLLHLLYPFDGYWSPVSFGSKYNVFWGMIVSFAVFGWATSERRRGGDVELLGLLLLSFLIGSVVFYGSPRFRLPLEPILISFAAAGIHRLFAARRHTACLIIVVNFMLFFLFRHFELRGAFDYAKAWL
jgi:4-amino-4-deoxy-L-arabinose transferase-like glycosyltransferase